MQDRVEISAPVVGDVVEIVGPGCGPAELCGCDLHRLVGHRGRVERVAPSGSGLFDLVFIDGMKIGWFADEVRVVEQVRQPHYRPLADVQSTELMRVIDAAMELGWRVAGVVAEDTWTDIAGAEDETARLHPPTAAGTLWVFATAGQSLSALLRLHDGDQVVTTTTSGTDDVLRCIRAHGLVDAR